MPRRLVRWAAGGAAALMLAGCSGMFLWPERPLVRTPAELGLAYDDLQFASADGTALHGWYLRASGRPRGSILFCHGNAENISTHIGFVRWLPAHGYNVLIWDYRGYGSSGGEPEVATLHEDALAALALLAERAGFRDELVVYGQSLGGTVGIRAVVASPYRAQVRAVISESTFATYRGIAREKLGALWLTWLFQWPASFLFPDDLSAERVIAELSPIPLLIAHGDADAVVPISHADRLYARAREPKTLWRIPGARHAEALAAPATRTRLLLWLDHALRG